MPQQRQYFRIKFQVRAPGGQRGYGIEVCTDRDLGDRIAAITRRFVPGAVTVRAREITPESYALLQAMLS